MQEGKGEKSPLLPCRLAALSGEAGSQFDAPMVIFQREDVERVMSGDDRTVFAIAGELGIDVDFDVRAMNDFLVASTRCGASQFYPILF